MNDTPCPHPDEFDADRPPADRDAFQWHLARCPACRERAEAHRRIDALLAGANRSVPCPPGLTDRVARRLRARRRRRLVLAGAAAALVVGAVAAVLLSRPGSGGEGGAPVIAAGGGHSEPRVAPDPEVAPPPREVPGRPEVTVRFPRDGGILAVETEEEHPGVTLIWLYPTIHAHRPVQPAGQSPPDERDPS